MIACSSPFVIHYSFFVIHCSVFICGSFFSSFPRGLNGPEILIKQKTILLFAAESSYYVAAMAEDLTPKQIFMQKLIAVVFTLALFVLMVWGILQLTASETTKP